MIHRRLFVPKHRELDLVAKRQEFAGTAVRPTVEAGGLAGRAAPPPRYAVLLSGPAAGRSYTGHMQFATRGLLLLWLCVGLAEAREPAPLFVGESDVEMTLALPLGTLLRKRAERVQVEGAATLAGADDVPIALDVKVAPRGRHRLANCGFPPLRLDFRRSQVEGTLLAGQNRLKLVTPCRPTATYARYLELEHLVYRMYQQVSDVSFHVRRARMRYVDSDRGGAVTAASAIFIEPIEGVAVRLGLTVVEVPQLPLDALDPRALTTLALFQFVIGNTDWSATAGTPGEDCCHNAAVLAPPRQENGLLLVPYDFDQTGLVDAEYATPNELFTLSSVRQRLYRGYCRTNEHLAETIQAFNVARPALMALLDDARLPSVQRDRTRRYLDGAFLVLNDPRRVEREIVGRCRSG